MAVIELTEDLNRISFTNSAGFEFLKSAYSKSKNLVEEALPPQLKENQFLRKQLQSLDSESDIDRQFNNEILSLPLLQKYFVDKNDEMIEENEDWSLRKLACL